MVIPDHDALYVPQINADAPAGRDNVLIAATDVIDEQTSISLYQHGS